MRKVLTVAVLAGASFAWGQAPADADASALIEKAREKALAYAQSLPDFVATEVIRRYSGPAGTTFQKILTDTLTVQLRYFQHKEEHKLILYNGEPTTATFDEVGGLVGRGEFGATISAIFSPESQTHFEFQKRITVRRRPAVRFAYEVDQAHSHYSLTSKTKGPTATATVGYHGFMEIDAETGEVVHLEYIADRIPKELHLSRASTVVDYALADIAGREYLLPSHSETELHSDQWVRNAIEFRDYRRFSADSSIEFGLPK